MNSSRRLFGAQFVAGSAGVLLGACGGSNATAPAKAKRAIVLVHGSWFGSWCYAQLIPLLSAKGITCVAPDLPGHGLDAQFPTSFNVRPLDPNAFGTEPSPLASLTLANYASVVVSAVNNLAAGGFDAITVLGHSMGGIPITVAGETIPKSIAKLIYLSAFMPVTGNPAGAYFSTPQGMQNQLSPLFVADPTVVGALRMDTGSTDMTYIAKMKTAFAADTSDTAFAAVRHLMTPDDPAQPFGVSTGATAANWGSIKRTYIGCSQDNAVTPDLQQLFIGEADKLTPTNLTDFHSIASSHSPFVSQPQALADLIASVAA